MSGPVFRTEIRLTPSPWKIAHPDRIFCIGSCFAEHLHQQFRASGFHSACNPCGIVYNPLSIGIQITRILQGKDWEENDLIHYRGLYHGLHHHGSFSSSEQEACLSRMNDSLGDAQDWFDRTDVLVLTLGTAIWYKHQASGQAVANCHKIPAGEFERRFMSPEEVVQSVEGWLPELQKRRPGIKIILTISPVRYLKEGFRDNSISKATLVLAAEQLSRLYDNVFYFPAYEILLDDLRDYRFYKEDMVHPSDQSVQYIWSGFQSVYFSTETRQMVNEVSKLNEARSHRPLHPGSPEHKTFMTRLKILEKELKAKYPELRLE